MSDGLVCVGARCILQVGTQFFLLVEFEAAGVEQVVVFRITAAQAATLLRSGIRLCEVVNEIPTPAPGETVEFLCVLVIGSMAFLVFDVETATSDELVLVRADLCPIVG